MRQRDLAVVEHDDRNVIEGNTCDLLLFHHQREVLALESRRAVDDDATPDHAAPRIGQGRCDPTRRR